MAELQLAAPSEPVSVRLRELGTVLTSAFLHPRRPALVDGWTTEWRISASPANERASYGHALELVWLALANAPLLGLDTQALLPWALRVSDHALSCGWDRQHGGFALTGPLHGLADDWRKEWWVQAEALVAMLWLFRLTGRSAYYAAFEETLSFIERSFLAPGGGWWATLAADGAPLVRTRATRWQCAYHTARSMVQCSHLLDEMSGEREALAGFLLPRTP